MTFAAFCSCIFVMFFTFRNFVFSMFLLIWFKPWMSTAVYCAIIVLYHAMVFTDFKLNCTNFSCKKYIISIDKMNEEKMITLETEDGERVDFYVLEETRINGTNYLLVTDSEEDDEEGECYILKDQSKAEDADALYEFVEDDEEMDYLYKIFAELMDDMDVDLEK